MVWICKLYGKKLCDSVCIQVKTREEDWSLNFTCIFYYKSLPLLTFFFFAAFMKWEECLRSKHLSLKKTKKLHILQFYEMKYILYVVNCLNTYFSTKFNWFQTKLNYIWADTSVHLYEVKRLWNVQKHPRTLPSKERKVLLSRKLWTNGDKKLHPYFFSVFFKPFL